MTRTERDARLLCEANGWSADDEQTVQIYRPQAERLHEARLTILPLEPPAETIDAMAREAFIENAACRMRNSVSSVHAEDAYQLERKLAGERWDDPAIIDTEFGERNLWRQIARAAYRAALDESGLSS